MTQKIREKQLVIVSCFLITIQLFQPVRTIQTKRIVKHVTINENLNRYHLYSELDDPPLVRPSDDELRGLKSALRQPAKPYRDFTSFIDERRKAFRDAYSDSDDDDDSSDDNYPVVPKTRWDHHEGTSKDRREEHQRGTSAEATLNSKFLFKNIDGSSNVSRRNSESWGNMFGGPFSPFKGNPRSQGLKSDLEYKPMPYNGRRTSGLAEETSQVEQTNILSRVWKIIFNSRKNGW